LKTGFSLLPVCASTRLDFSPVESVVTFQVPGPAAKPSGKAPGSTESKFQARSVLASSPEAGEFQTLPNRNTAATGTN
jgi:hypothetical protein